MGIFRGTYKNPLRNLRDFLRYDIPQGIKSLIIYAPVIWKQRDWDYEYMLTLLEFKLEQMEKGFRTNNTYIDHDSDVKELREIIDLLQFRNKEPNTDDIYKPEIIWGEQRAGGTGITFSGTEEQRRIYMDRLHNHDKEIHENIQKAFELIGKHYRGWWD